MAKKSDDAAKLSYEEALERLEAIIDQIEAGEVGLEDTLKQYEAGTALVKRCREILDRTEQRIAELSTDADGELVVEGEEDCGRCDACG